MINTYNGEKLNNEEVEGYEKLKISPSGRIDFFLLL